MSLVLFLNKVLAAQAGVGENPGNINLQNVSPLKGNLLTVIQNILSPGKLGLVIIPIATIMIVYGAFQIMTAGGNPEKVTKGRHTILYAAIGLGVFLMAGAIVGILQSFIQSP